VITYSSIACGLDKSYLSYGIIISKADLIIEGKISEVLDGKYKFEISDLIKGNSQKYITVNHWKQWTCDKRIKPVALGQRLFLFLTRSKDGSFDIIHGSSGELFVNTDNSVETFINKKFPKISDLKESIQLFIKAFEYHGKLYERDREKIIFKRLIDKIEVDRLINEKPFFYRLYRPIQSYIKN